MIILCTFFVRKIKGAIEITYYYELLKLIRDGKPINKWVCKALDRVPHYLTTYKYNRDYVTALINFIENNMYLQKGGNGKLVLQTEQKFWIEMLGFEHDDGRPVITDLAIILGAGSGKSTFLASLSLAVMLVGSHRGNDVLVFANSIRQAHELFRTSTEIVKDERSSLYEFYKRDLLEPIINKIRYTPTNSVLEIKAMDNRTADGVNVRMVVFDEFHAYTTNIIENVRKSTAPKRKETGYTIVYSSTNGQTRGAVFDDYMNKWQKILTGETDDDTIFPILYGLDNASEALDPSQYEKALPFIKDISSPDIILDMVTKAKGNPTAQAEILAKTFNIPQQEYNSLFTSDVLLNAQQNFEPIPHGSSIYVGYDLSAVDDLSAIVFAYRNPQGQFFITGHAFIPETTFNNRTSREQRERYAKFIAQGTLTLVKEPTVQGKTVFEYMQKYTKDNGYTISGVIGDNFYNREFRDAVSTNYGEDTLKQLRQTVKYLSEPLKNIKASLLSNNLFLDSDILIWNFANLRVKIDANNNIFPNKEKSSDKIDFVSATIGAVYGYLNEDDATAYEW